MERLQSHLFVEFCLVVITVWWSTSCMCVRKTALAYSYRQPGVFSPQYFCIDIESSYNFLYRVIIARVVFWNPEAQHERNSLEGPLRLGADGVAAEPPGVGIGGRRTGVLPFRRLADESWRIVSRMRTSRNRNKNKCNPTAVACEVESMKTFQLLSLLVCFVLILMRVTCHQIGLY